MNEIKPARTLLCLSIPNGSQNVKCHRKLQQAYRYLELRIYKKPAIIFIQTWCNEKQRAENASQKAQQPHQYRETILRCWSFPAEMAKLNKKNNQTMVWTGPIPVVEGGGHPAHFWQSTTKILPGVAVNAGRLIIHQLIIHRRFVVKNDLLSMHNKINAKW